MKNKAPADTQPEARKHWRSVAARYRHGVQVPVCLSRYCPCALLSLYSIQRLLLTHTKCVHSAVRTAVPVSIRP